VKADATRLAVEGGARGPMVVRLQHLLGLTSPRSAERTNHGTPLRSAYARPLRKSDDTYRSLAGAGLSSFCLTQPVRIKSAARSTLRGGVVEGGDLGATGSGDRARTKVTDSPTRTLAV
jgi:hypothetical protein